LFLFCVGCFVLILFRLLFCFDFVSFVVLFRFENIVADSFAPESYDRKLLRLYPLSFLGIHAGASTSTAFSKFHSAIAVLESYLKLLGL